MPLSMFCCQIFVVQLALLRTVSSKFMLVQTLPDIFYISYVLLSAPERTESCKFINSVHSVSVEMCMFSAFDGTNPDAGILNRLIVLPKSRWKLNRSRYCINNVSGREYSKIVS